MSNLCKTELCSTVQSVVTGIENTCDTTDILFSSFSIDRIEPTNRISKALFKDLPEACTVPNGHVAYLDDAKVPVIASNCSWIGFDGRTVGTFLEDEIWAWGCGSCGRLGDGTLTNRCSPVREFCSATDWCQVSSGDYHTSAIKKTGELWAWGRNSDGKLGDGTVTTRCSPVREFCSATDWCQVSGGGLHTAAIKTSGQIWSWGLGSSGRLGDGTANSKCSPVREICSATDWCQVSAERNTTAAIKTSGQLWGWGVGACGSLGDGNATSRCSPVREICSATDWCQVSAFCNNTLAIKTSGQLWVWGANGCGSLGDGTVTSRCSPVREICSATNWCQVNAGLVTSAIKTSGELWSWGLGNSGRLGDGTTVDKCSPVREFCSATDWCQVSAGVFASAAIKTTGQLWAWGCNPGAIGDGTFISRCSPVREISSSTDWCQVSTGRIHTAAIKSITIVCR